MILSIASLTERVLQLHQEKSISVTWAEICTYLRISTGSFIQHAKNLKNTLRYYSTLLSNNLRVKFRYQPHTKKIHVSYAHTFIIWY